MRVFGYMSDHNATAPFPEPGDGLGLMLVLTVALCAAGAAWWPPCLGLASAVMCYLIFGGTCKLRLLGGDVYDPHGPWTIKPCKRNGLPIARDEAPNWFNAVPAGATRFTCHAPLLPYIALAWGRFGVYLGAKVYGFDSPEYRDFPNVSESDVYGPGPLGTPGSRAICFSLRFTGARPT